MGDIEITYTHKEAFKDFMKLMKGFMKAQGFTSRGNNFYKRHPEGNIGVISFQKSVQSFGRFYINVGVYSVALAEFFLRDYAFEKEPKVKTHPSEPECHWRARIRFLISMKNPDYERVKVGYWNCWDCDDESDAAALAAEISYLIEKYAIPAIDERITDRQIFDRWFNSNWKDSCNAHLKHLAALALIMGKDEKLKVVLAEFQKHLPACAKDYARVAKAVGFDTDRQIFERCFAADWQDSSRFTLLYLADLALSLGEREKLKAVLTEIKKELPKPSLKIAQHPTFKKLREGYQRIVQEAGLEGEGF